MEENAVKKKQHVTPSEDVGVQNWKAVALNRDRWRRVVKAATKRWMDKDNHSYNRPLI